MTPLFLGLVFGVAGALYWNRWSDSVYGHKIDPGAGVVTVRLFIDGRQPHQRVITLERGVAYMMARDLDTVLYEMDGCLPTPGPWLIERKTLP